MAKKRKKLVTPYTTAFKGGSSGPDRLAVKRALRHSGDLKKKGNLDDRFGAMAIAALKKFQKRNGIERGVGTYTTATHEALRAHHHFDAYGAHLMQTAKRRTGKEGKRNKVVSSALFAYHHAPRHYTQTAARAEGYYRKIRPPDMWNYSDCSAFCLWTYWLAGVDDVGPYDGWTGSMLEHGRTVSFANAKPGDSVFYNSPVTHVAMLVSKKGGGMVATHGHEGGPFYTSMRYRSDLNVIRNFID